MASKDNDISIKIQYPWFLLLGTPQNQATILAEHPELAGKSETEIMKIAAEEFEKLSTDEKNSVLQGAGKVKENFMEWLKVRNDNTPINDSISTEDFHSDEEKTFEAENSIRYAHCDAMLYTA